jgi:hypothetical protein
MRRRSVYVVAEQTLVKVGGREADKGERKADGGESSHVVKDWMKTLKPKVKGDPFRAFVSIKRKLALVASVQQYQILCFKNGEFCKSLGE